MVRRRARKEAEAPGTELADEPAPGTELADEPAPETPSEVPDRTPAWPGDPEPVWAEEAEQEWVLPEEEQDAEPPARAPRRVLGVLLALFSVIVAAAAGLGAAAVNESRADSYVSRAALLVDQQAAIALSRDPNLLLKLNALRIRYSSIVASTSFRDEVAAQTQLPKAQVRAALGTVTPPVSLLMMLTARTDDAETSRAISAAAADLLVKRSDDEQRAAAIPARLQVRLVLVSPAEPGTRVGPDHQRSAALGAGAFVAVLVLAALARTGLRRRSRT